MKHSRAGANRSFPILALTAALTLFELPAAAYDSPEDLAMPDAGPDPKRFEVIDPQCMTWKCRRARADAEKERKLSSRIATGDASLIMGSATVVSSSNGASGMATGPGALIESTADTVISDTVASFKLDSKLFLIGVGESDNQRRQFMGARIQAASGLHWYPEFADGMRLQLGPGIEGNVSGTGPVLGRNERNSDLNYADLRLDLRAQGTLGLAFMNEDRLFIVSAVGGATGPLDSNQLLHHEGARARVVLGQELVATAEVLRHIGLEDANERQVEIAGTVRARAGDSVWLGVDSRYSTRRVPAQEEAGAAVRDSRDVQVTANIALDLD